MTIKVLIVDDSSFLLQQIKNIINIQTDMVVVGQAINGKEAIEKAKELKPDVITMDYEMPLMDGISAVKVIMSQCPTNILMFSSLTYEGAQTTLDALDAGAVDFLSKSFEGVSNNKSRLSNILCKKIREVSLANKSNKTISNSSNNKPVEPIVEKTLKPEPSKNHFGNTAKVDLIAIGASTGGPVALANILNDLPANFSIPILIIQHMPATFTGAFAQRLNERCALSIKMAENDDKLDNGGVFIAPGGKQMLVTPGGRISLKDGGEKMNYKPSIDLTFASCSSANFKHVLGLVLTGMGSDGKKGAQLLSEKGHEIWVQSSISCVVDGMPSSILNANLADCVYHLDDLSKQLMDLK